MELNVDLLKKNEKSVFHIILGLLCLCFVISFIWIDNKMPTEHFAPLLDWVFGVVLVLLGIFFTIDGFGFSLAKLFGKAFIIIDQERISIKANPFVKEQKVLWDDIKSIDYNLSRYHIVKANDNKQIIDLSKFDYSLLKNIKETVSNIAKGKGLVVNEI